MTATANATPAATVAMLRATIAAPSPATTAAAATLALLRAATPAPLPTPAPAPAAAAPVPPRHVKQAHESGNNAAQRAGNAAIVEAMCAAGRGELPYQTGRQLADRGGFKTAIPTAYLRDTLAFRAQMQLVYKPGQGNLYAYALVPFPTPAAA